MSDEKVDQKLCDERMETVSCDLREIKADIKTLLARTNAYSASAEATKGSLETLWDQFNAHKEGHWKWVAIWLGILSAISILVVVYTSLLKPHTGG